MENLLLSTHNRVVLWDGHRETVVLSGDSSYFGVTANEDSYFFGGRLSDRRGTVVRVHDRDLQHQCDIPLLGVASVHDILWADGLLVCDTGHHRVVKVEGGELRAVYQPHDLQRGRYHINSVWQDGDGHFYTSELSSKRVRKFDADWNLEQEWKLDHAVHNVYAENGTVWTCASGKGCLLAMNGDGNQYFPVAQGDFDYARGLARSGDYFYVGLSLTSQRADRGTGDSAVVVFDGERVVDTFIFKDTGQMNTVYLVAEE